MSIFMCAEGVAGSATHSDYEGWIELERVYFPGVSTPASHAVGQGRNKVTELPTFGQIALVKMADASSNRWFRYATSTQFLPSVQIDFVSSGNPAELYQRYVLTDAIVTHFSEAQGHADHRAQEFITLAYNQIEKTIVPYDSEGNAGTREIVGYHLAEAKAL